MTGRAPLPKLHPDQLDQAQRELYRAIVDGPRGSGPRRFPLVDDEGGLEGPFNGFLLQPVLGNRLQALGEAVRFSSWLSDRHREIAILMVAAHWHSDFEQYAHEPIGRAAGLTERELEAIRHGVDSASHMVWTDPDDRLVVGLVRSLLSDNDIDDDQYRTVSEVLGLTALFELLTLVGYYAMLALQLRVFRVAPPDH